MCLLSPQNIWAVCITYSTQFLFVECPLPFLCDSDPFYPIFPVNLSMISTLVYNLRCQTSVFDKYIHSTFYKFMSSSFIVKGMLCLESDLVSDLSHITYMLLRKTPNISNNRLLLVKIKNENLIYFPRRILKSDELSLKPMKFITSSHAFFTFWLPSFLLVTVLE